MPKLPVVTPPAPPCNAAVQEPPDDQDEEDGDDSDSYDREIASLEALVRDGQNRADPDPAEPPADSPEADRVAYRICLHLIRLHTSNDYCRGWFCPKAWTEDHRTVMVRFAFSFSPCLRIDEARKYLSYLDGGGHMESYACQSPVAVEAAPEQKRGRFMGRRKYARHNRRGKREGSRTDIPQGGRDTPGGQGADGNNAHSQ